MQSVFLREYIAAIDSILWPLNDVDLMKPYAESAQITHVSFDHARQVPADTDSRGPRTNRVPICHDYYTGAALARAAINRGTSLMSCQPLGCSVAVRSSSRPQME